MSVSNKNTYRGSGTKERRKRRMQRPKPPEQSGIARSCCRPSPRRNLRFLLGRNGKSKSKLETELLIFHVFASACTVFIRIISSVDASAGTGLSKQLPHHTSYRSTFNHDIKRCRVFIKPDVKSVLYKLVRMYLIDCLKFVLCWIYWSDVP